MFALFWNISERKQKHFSLCLLVLQVSDFSSSGPFLQYLITYFQEIHKGGKYKVYIKQAEPNHCVPFEYHIHSEKHNILVGLFTKSVLAVLVTQSVYRAGTTSQGPFVGVETEYIPFLKQG